MARLFIDGEWYEELSATAIYEHEFENVVCAHGGAWYSQYHVLSFKKHVYSEEGSAIADLALIDRKYREWWVVEVEVATHSLEHHVLPQVRVLSQAKYGRDEAVFLCERFAGLDRDRMLDMVKGLQPRVLVIVNSAMAEWAKHLRVYDASLVTVETYRSPKNRYIYRIEGDSLTRPDRVLSECHVDSVMPGFLAVASPAVLEVPRLGNVDLRYGDAVTRWKRVDLADRVWLMPLGANPLSGGKTYYIVRLEDGSLALSPVPEV